MIGARTAAQFRLALVVVVVRLSKNLFVVFATFGFFILLWMINGSVKLLEKSR